MLDSHVLVNEARFQVQDSFTNGLTNEAKNTFKTDVDIKVIHTDLTVSGMDVVSPDTFSLIFYVPGTLDLLNRVNSPLCVTINWMNQGVRIGVFRYEAGRYVSFNPPFDTTMNGSLGCTGAAGLGFYLLSEVAGVDTDSLGILSLVDTSALERMEADQLPVADDSLIEFCRSRGHAKVYVAPDESDCQNYTECIGQPGMRCDLARIKCKN